MELNVSQSGAQGDKTANCDCLLLFSILTSAIWLSRKPPQMWSRTASLHLVNGLNPIGDSIFFGLWKPESSTCTIGYFCPIRYGIKVWEHISYSCETHQTPASTDAFSDFCLNKSHIIVPILPFKKSSKRAISSQQGQSKKKGIWPLVILVASWLAQITLCESGW